MTCSSAYLDLRENDVIKIADPGDLDHWPIDLARKFFFLFAFVFCSGKFSFWSLFSLFSSFIAVSSDTEKLLFAGSS